MASKPLVQIDGLSYAYPTQAAADTAWALQDIRLGIQDGEVLAVMGPAGAGKTTLALALLGIVPQSYGGRIRGQVVVAGLDTRSTPVARLARAVGLVFENPDSQFLMTDVESEVAFGLENMALPRAEIGVRIGAILEALGLQGFEARTPRGLSGGEKQRVALAAILAMKPRLLVLDEPATRLDHVGSSGLKSALAELRRQANTAMVIVSNDSDWLQGMADRVLLLNRGQMEGLGSSGEIFANKALLHRAGILAPFDLRLGEELSLAGLDPRLAASSEALLSWFEMAADDRR